MDKKDIEALAREAAPIIREYVTKQLEPLQRRLAVLEQRESNFKYLGTWQPAGEYVRGNFCTYDGSVWHCNRTTTERPGAGNGWTLAVKRGKDAA